MTSFPIQSGKTICFTDTENEVLTIQLIDTYNQGLAYNRFKYRYMYATTEFDLQIEIKASYGNRFSRNLPKQWRQL